MNLTAIQDQSLVFLDANIFVYAFAPEPTFGPFCQQLLERVELQAIQGMTSSQVLSDVAHRLMCLEACQVWGWPYQGIAARLQRHPAEIQKLVRFREAVSAVSAIGVKVLTVTAGQVEIAAALSQQFGLLSNDALILALMQENGIDLLASHDSDFDRVTNISRFSVV